jgi:hypothetical protein
MKTTLTKLEKFVWHNQDALWNDLASQTNRTFNAIAAAYKRASLKVAARDGVPVVTPAPAVKLPPLPAAPARNPVTDAALKVALARVTTDKQARAVLFHLLGGLSVLDAKTDLTIAACIERALAD